MKKDNLPTDINSMLIELNASPRLIAHLTIVYGVAKTICEELENNFSELTFDRRVVLRGAALHDIGKVFINDEIINKGNKHEVIGYDFLISKGEDSEIALIAKYHSNWEDYKNINNLLVALADNIWKGKRNIRLESLIIEIVVSVSPNNKWNTFITFDNILENIASEADDRLVYQTGFSVD